MTSSVGSLTIEEGLGLTGQSFSASVGSISLTDITVGLDSFEATFSVGAVDIFAYGDVDTGSNTSYSCLLYTSPSPRDQRGSRMPSSA